MSTSTIDSPTRPPGAKEDDRLVVMALRLPKEQAAAFTEALGAFLSGQVLDSWGAHHVVGPAVVMRDFERATAVSVAMATVPAKYDRQRLALRTGDIVRTIAEGGHPPIFARVTAVHPGDFNDGPTYELEGVPGLKSWIDIDCPKDEVEAHLWALKLGDEIEYWCAETVDRLGRHRRARWHPPGFACSGRGEWHRTRVTEIDYDWEHAYSTFDRNFLSFRVEDTYASPNERFCDITVSPESGLLRFRWRHETEAVAVEANP